MAKTLYVTYRKSPTRRHTAHRPTSYPGYPDFVEYDNQRWRITGINAELDMIRLEAVGYSADYLNTFGKEITVCAADIGAEWREEKAIRYTIIESKTRRFPHKP